MKLILINPGVDSFQNNKQKKINQTRLYCPALGLPYLAALTPSHIDIEIIDEENEVIKEYKSADLVGITGKTIQAPRMYEIADMYRSMGVPVILGGVHVSFMQDEAKQHADSIVIGEAEDLWQNILKDFASGKLNDKYECSSIPDLDRIPFPRLDLIKGPAYMLPRGSLNAIMTTRGCPYNCSFCSVGQMFGHTIRKRSIKCVISEINGMNKKNFFLFYDDNIFNFRDYSMALFKALQPINIKWGGHASLDIANDLELLKTAYKSGCRSLLIGVESLNPENNEYIAKNVDKELFGQQIKIIRNQGINNLTLTFIVGFDNDTNDTFDEIYDFIVENEIYSAQVSLLTPIPGTNLYTDLKNDNRIIDTNWSNYDLTHVVFNPNNFSVNDLQNQYDNLVSKLNRYSFRKIISEINK